MMVAAVYRPLLRYLIGVRNFCLLQSLQTDCRGLFLQEISGWGVKVTTRLHLVPRLRLGGALRPLPLYAFMPCTGTAFTFYLSNHNTLRRPERRTSHALSGRGT